MNTSTWDSEPTFAINDTFLFYQTRGRRGDGGKRDDNDSWMVPIKRPELGVEQPNRLDPAEFGLTVPEEGWALTRIIRPHKKAPVASPVFTRQWN